MGKMPTVLKMARQMNHANWSCRALFHRAISFQMPSQIARMNDYGDEHNKQRAFHILSLVDGFGCSDYLMK